VVLIGYSSTATSIIPHLDAIVKQLSSGSLVWRGFAGSGAREAAWGGNVRNVLKRKKF
jgi:hypothetical protein